MTDDLRIPYTQQFTPEQTPLRQLLPILRQHEGARGALRTAIAAAFFKSTKTPEKIAGNTLISLGVYGILDGANLTDFGHTLVSFRDDAQAAREIARHILLEMDGVAVVETLREMKSAGVKIALGTTLPQELRKRGFKTSANSSDLSGMLGWLRAAGVLCEYDVNEGPYKAIVGTDVDVVGELKTLAPDHLYFLRSLIALGTDDFIDHSQVCSHAEGLYPGQVRYNRKELDRTLLRPLQQLGYVEVRRKEKSSPGARGGKAAEVRATAKLNKDLGDRILGALARAAGYADLREISGKSWAQVVAALEQHKDQDLRAKSLEHLAIKVCQTLDLDFMGWRATDEEITAGGEVDAMLHSSRLLYSRWQVQCKASPRISYEAIAKEVGASHVTLASVILIVSTGQASKSAKTYRDHIVRSTNLNIILLEGHHLKRIIANPAEIVAILNEQAHDALQIKGRPPGVSPPIEHREGQGQHGQNETATAPGRPVAKEPR